MTPSFAPVNRKGYAPSRRLLLLVIAIFTLAVSQSAFGQNSLYWDKNGLSLGGTGNWDTMTSDWSTSSTPLLITSTTWANGDNAFFEGTAGTVTVDAGAVSAVGLNFTIGGYTINGTGTNTVTVTSNGTGTSSAIDATNTTLTNTISAPVILGAAAAATQTFTQTSGGTLAISGVISSTNAIAGLTLTGGGAFTFSGANTYSGGTTLSAGTLQLSGSGTLGSTSGTLTVNAGTLDLNGTNQGVGNFTGTGGTILNNSTGTNVTLTVGNSNGTGGNYSGVIADHTSGTGTVALTKTGTGTITLSGADTYTGATTVSAGTLNAGATNALGSTSGITVSSSGTLLISGNGNLNRINNSAGITLAGGTFGRASNGSNTVSEGAGAQNNNGTVTGTSSVGLGALTLTANSNLDFQSGSGFNANSGGVGTLVFSSFTPNGHVLDILDYSSTATPAVSGTDGSNDRLIFNQDQQSNLADFVFVGGPVNGLAREIALDSGFFEIVPIPEPNTWAGGALALAFLFASRIGRWKIKDRMWRRRALSAIKR